MLSHYFTGKKIQSLHFINFLLNLFVRGQIFTTARNKRKDPSSAEDEAVSTERSGGIEGANTTAWRLRKG